VLTIAKLSRWSINCYNDTAHAVGQAATDAKKAGGGLGEYYTEHDTGTPVWLCAGDTDTAARTRRFNRHARTLNSSAGGSVSARQYGEHSLDVVAKLLHVVA
jgi:hypothetical protein